MSRQEDPTVVWVKPKFVFQYKGNFTDLKTLPFRLNFLSPSWSLEECFFRRVTARQLKWQLLSTNLGVFRHKSRHFLYFSDIDECRITPRKCTGDQEICVNSYGSYSCRCRDQFQRNRRTQKCERKFLTKNYLKVIDHFFTLGVEDYRSDRNGQV